MIRMKMLPGQCDGYFVVIPLARDLGVIAYFVVDLPFRSNPSTRLKESAMELGSLAE